ncbi:MAG: FRG domain-containing protein, partial [Acidobacteria bacterium]|nr:FRG domain-containing protein [Acidobacteriota bacterium]
LSAEEARRCSTTVEWLVLTQHYGLPTRLLDWTESILVALYFAAHDDNVDGCLIVLNARLLNRFASLNKSRSICMPGFPDAVLRADQSLCASYTELLDRWRNSFPKGEFFKNHYDKIGEDRIREVLNLPIAIYPPKNNPRITSQSGMFTLHGGDTASISHESDYGDPVSLDEIHEKGPEILTKFRIPAKAKNQIRHDLGRLGIHQAALFPEFENQARYIRQKWTREVGP